MLIKISEIRENKGRRLAEVAKVEELAESIEQIGLINPITVTETNNQYLLVAGLHRLEAHKMLGKDKIEANILTGTDLELELAEIDENLVRNELHYTELDDLILRKKVIYEDIYPQTKAGGDRNSESFKTTLCRFEKPSFSEDTATKTGQSKRNIQRSTQRAENLIPEAKSILREKEITQTEATLLAKEEPAQQKRIIKILQDGKVETVNQAYKEIKNIEKKIKFEKQIEDIRTTAVEMPTGKYQCIVLDPPWSYGTKYSATGRRVANPYPEMSQDELKELEILSEDDSIIFLWTTQRFIWDAKELLEHWGFNYRSMIVWDKEQMGMGDLLRMQCEFCLVGIKGKPLLNNPNNIRDIIREPRREHSRKPESFYEIVNTLCVGSKIEYFSRTEREGWKSFGNETDKF